MKATAEIDREMLIIKLPLQKAVRSKSSGKTWVIASTHGALTTEARYRGKRIVVVANAFVYPSKKRTAQSTERTAGWESRHDRHRI